MRRAHRVGGRALRRFRRVLPQASVFIDQTFPGIPPRRTCQSVATNRGVEKKGKLEEKPTEDIVEIAARLYKKGKHEQALHVLDTYISTEKSTDPKTLRRALQGKVVLEFQHSLPSSGDNTAAWELLEICIQIVDNEPNIENYCQLCDARLWVLNNLRRQGLRTLDKEFCVDICHRLAVELDFLHSKGESAREYTKTIKEFAGKAFSTLHDLPKSAPVDILGSKEPEVSHLIRDNIKTITHVANIFSDKIERRLNWERVIDFPIVSSLAATLELSIEDIHMLKNHRKNAPHLAKIMFEHTLLEQTERKKWNFRDLKTVMMLMLQGQLMSKRIRSAVESSNEYLGIQNSFKSNRADLYLSLCLIQTLAVIIRSKGEMEEKDEDITRYFPSAFGSYNPFQDDKSEHLSGQKGLIQLVTIMLTTADQLEEMKKDRLLHDIKTAKQSGCIERVLKEAISLTLEDQNLRYNHSLLNKMTKDESDEMKAPEQGWISVDDVKTLKPVREILDHLAEDERPNMDNKFFTSLAEEEKSLIDLSEDGVFIRRNIPFRSIHVGKDPRSFLVVSKNNLQKYSENVLALFESGSYHEACIQTVGRALGENHYLAIRTCMHVFGRYLQLGEDEKAEAIMDNLLELKSKSWDIQGIEELYDAAKNMYHMKRFGDAEDLLRMSGRLVSAWISESRTSRLERGSYLQFQCSKDLGMTLLEMGEIEKAKDVLQNSLVRLEDKRNSSDNNVRAKIQHALAQVYIKDKMYKEAKGLLKMSIKHIKSLMKTWKSPINAQTAILLATMYGHIGECQFRSGDYVWASRNIFMSHRMKAHLLGERDRQTLIELNNLASVEMSQKKYKASERLYKKLIEALIIEDGENSKTVAVARYWLANVHVAQGHLEDALVSMEQCVRVIKTELPIEKQGPFWKRYSEILGVLGKVDEAKAAENYACLGESETSVRIVPT
ncbi:hypothetical protein AAMO2058_000171100 [Amorphochlora amoebiformis]